MTGDLFQVVTTAEIIHQGSRKDVVRARASLLAAEARHHPGSIHTFFFLRLTASQRNHVFLARKICKLSWLVKGGSLRLSDLFRRIVMCDGLDPLASGRFRRRFQLATFTGWNYKF